MPRSFQQLAGGKFGWVLVACPGLVEPHSVCLGWLVGISEEWVPCFGGEPQCPPCKTAQTHFLAVGESCWKAGNRDNVFDLLEGLT